VGYVFAVCCPTPARSAQHSNDRRVSTVQGARRFRLNHGCPWAAPAAHRTATAQVDKSRVLLYSRAMKSTVLLLAGALTAGFAAGCSSDTPTAPTQIAPSPVPHVLNYAGTWTGTITRSGCTETPGLGLCSRLVSDISSFRGTFAQSGNTVTGTMSIGRQYGGNVAGSVTSAGALVLDVTTFTIPLPFGTGGLRIVGWTSTLSPSGVMSANYVEFINITGPDQGQATLRAVLTDGLR
jgi:hypothetical protein